MNRQTVLHLAPNEVGDFLSGAFAPLAFLWLVLGFFQQGKELRNSSEALQMQGRELQQSVEQQRELVEVTREQLKFESDRLTAQRQEAERNAQPILDLEEGTMLSSGSRIISKEFILTNHGRPCTRVKVHGKHASAHADVLKSGDVITFGVIVDGEENFQSSVHVSYLDELLNQRIKSFSIALENDQFVIQEI